MNSENGKLVVNRNPTELLQEARDFLQRVQLALQESTDFDEILDIRDRGELFRQYSRQQKYGVEIQNAGAEIRLFAIIWAESKSLHNQLISVFSGCFHFATQKPGVELA